MSLLRSMVNGSRTLFDKRAAERDLDDEVGHYVEMAAQEKMRAGLSRVDAVRAARLELGGIEATKERVRSGGWEAGVETMWHDVRYGIRGLRRNPGFAGIAVITLALGIGANTAMFSVVNAVMLRPLPYRDASRLALIWTDDARRGLHQEATAHRTITDWRVENRSFFDIAFFTTERTAAMTNGPTGSRERTRSALVSANLFPLLGVLPLRGRFISADDEANREPVALISYAFWERAFGGAADVIGKTFTTEGGGKGGTEVLTIIGVMPAAFYFPDKGTEIWTPATTYWRFARESSERFPQWARRWTAIGRLAPTVSFADARADLVRIGSRLSATYTSSVPDFPGFRTTVLPMLDSIAGKNLQSALWVLLAAVGLVLLVACANVANLLLARGAARQHEFAVRRALGAGRGRLMRQLVAESIVLALMGGLGGVLIAVWGTRILATAAAAYVPRIAEISVDAGVLLFAAAASIIAGLVFGLAPAFRVSATDASEALKDARHSIGGVRLRKSRGALVVAECSLAIVLLAGAGLLLKSLSRLQSVDPGFDPHGVLTMRLEFPNEGGPPTAEERTQTSQVAPARARAREQRTYELVTRLQGIPGVEAVGFTDDMFISGQGNESITIPGRATDSLGAGELNQADASPGFFPAMRVPLRRGRYLTRDDAAQKIRALWSLVITDMPLAEKERLATPEPVVVNETFVRRFFPADDPIGKRFCTDPTNKTYWYVIVGVVGDMHRQGLDRQTIPEYFGPYFPSPNGRADLLVRTSGDPLAIAPLIRREVLAAVPKVVIANVSTADIQLGGFSGQRRFQTWLLTAFALLALALAGIGIYGVVHYAVSERTREIGVRVALGAAPGDVVGLVIGQGMRMPAVGIAIGLAASIGLTRVISHLLFGVGATDPVTFVAVGGVLAAVALAACYIPARRATRIDPMTALRQE